MTSKSKSSALRTFSFRVLIMTSAAPRYFAWILPRWRDPLFWPRAAILSTALGLMILLSLVLARPVLGWAILLASVWPYRSVISIHDYGLRVGWLVFRSTISIGTLTDATLSPSTFGFYSLTVHRRDAPKLIFQGSGVQLTALRAALLSNFSCKNPTETGHGVHAPCA